MSLLSDYMCMPFIVFSIAGMPSSQALLGFLISAPPSVLVPAVLGALAVWIYSQKKNFSCGAHTHLLPSLLLANGAL